MPKRAPRHGHTPQGRRHERQREDKDRGTAASRGYDHRWQRLRKSKIHANPLCEHCEARGITKPADEVHHIKTVRERPDLRLDWDNLVSLCRDCHDLEHSSKPVIGTDGYPAV